MDVATLCHYLLVAALASATFQPVNSLFQLFRRSDAGAGWLAALLAAITALSTFAVLIVNTFVTPVQPDPLAFLMLLGLIQIAVGLLLYRGVERRRATFSPGSSFGLLMAGVGVLGIVSVLFIPILPGQFRPLPQASAEIATLTPTRRAAETPLPSRTSAPQISLTPSATTTASPTATVTPTRERYNTRTPAPTPIIEPFCGAMVAYNLNLRAAPDRGAEALGLIPFDSVIPVGGQNAAGDWWFVLYEDIWGWVDGAYIRLDPDCRNAPVIAR